MLFLRKSEYAAAKGWSRAYVSKLAKQERLVLTVTGLIDVAATDALLELGGDPSKAGVAARWAEHRQDRDVRRELDPRTANTALSDPDDGARPVDGQGYQYWRALREKELALAAQRERQKLEGSLVDAHDVQLAQESLARQIRDRLLSVPERLHLQLAAEPDPLKVLVLLEAEIRGCLLQLVADMPAQDTAVQ